MKRRDFLRTTAAGTAFVATSGLWGIRQAQAINLQNLKYCFQSERTIPVAYKVDVIVVGGSTAGVAAAVAASQKGASVFLAAQEPYLGEDICGTFRFANGAVNSTLGKKLFGAGRPTPMTVKRMLDEELITNKVNFLYSTYVTDLVYDENQKIAGVVIANRSGRQVVLGKTVIDATPRAMVTRMSSARFTANPSGKQDFRFVVVGNDAKNATELTLLDDSQTIEISKDTYKVYEYKVQVDMPDATMASFARAEQKARDLTWDPNQVESADLLFQIPPDVVFGQKKSEEETIDSEQISLKAFQPKKVERLYVLGGCADISRKAAEQLLIPGALIRIGERIGQEAADLIVGIRDAAKLSVQGKVLQEPKMGDVGELLDGLRPSLNIGEVKAGATHLPILGTYDVVVMGGGTAGAPAGLGAARNGASTLVIEYLHGMGGIGTLGMIGRYFFGYRHGFTNEVDAGVRALGGNNPRMRKRLDEWVFDWKTEWFRTEIRKAGGEIWFGAIGIGAYVENKQVKGVVVSTPYGRGVVLAKTVIDSTGSADIAIAAGAGYT